MNGTPGPNLAAKQDKELRYLLSDPLLPLNDLLNPL